MATKFAWVLKTPQSRLGIKAVFLGVAAFLFAGRGAIGAAFFVLLALVLYAFPPHRLRSVAGSLVVFLFLVIVSAPLAHTMIWRVALGIFSGALFYCMCALKEMVLAAHRGWRELITLVLLSFGVFLFFLFPLSSRFITYWLVLFVAAFISMREFLKVTPVALVIALLVAELSWGASLLPLTVVRAASLAVISAFVMVTIASRSLQGTLTRRALLTDISCSAALVLAIGAATQWGVGG